MSNDTVLRGHEVFASLNVNEMDELSSFSSAEQFKEGEIIFKHNQVGTHVYLLMEGVVYLQLPVNPPEFSLTISKVEKGELFGISPLLNLSHYTSMARCFTDTKALVIAAEPFRELLRSNCPVGLDVANRVAHIYFTRYIDLLKRLQNVVNQTTLNI